VDAVWRWDTGDTFEAATWRRNRARRVNDPVQVPMPQEDSLKGRTSVARKTNAAHYFPEE
jgi:hypothetical protein